MSPFWLVVGVLAAFRITRLIVDDAILDGARDRLHKRLPLRSKVGEMLDCTQCSGAYVSLGVVLVLAGWGQAGHWVLLPWAVAGGQSLLNSLDHTLNH